MFWNITLAGHEPTEEERVELAILPQEFEALELELRVKCHVAILMLAIDMEDGISIACVYNVHNAVADNIEKLSPPEKLAVVAAIGSMPE